MIKIAVAPDEAIAEMWGGVLQQAGIRCLLKKIDPLSVAYLVGAGPMAVEVLVDEEDEAQARDILGLED